jgi:hypothetical protein
MIAAVAISKSQHDLEDSVLAYNGVAHSLGMAPDVFLSDLQATSAMCAKEGMEVT